MKTILLAMALITGVAYANNCDDYKRKATKYEQMGMSAGNLDMGAKYLKMAISNKKKALNVCFYSHFDSVKIKDYIEDLEAMRKDMINEAANKRRQEMDVARESAP